MVVLRRMSVAILALAIASVLLGGCGALLRTPPATFEQGVEHLPGPSHVVLIGDPERAPRDLVIVFGNDDGDVFAEQQTAVRAGDVIRATAISLPNQRNIVLVDGRQCLGWFDFVVDSTTTIQLRFGQDGCEISTLKVEPDA